MFNIAVKWILFHLSKDGFDTNPILIWKLS